MTFLQIMREAYRARQAGVSAAVALTSVLGTDDDLWDELFEHCVKAARLESSLKKYASRK